MEHSLDHWTRGEVEDELARILRDPEFERNPSVSRFLAFVVAETLEGRGARLKAFTVAVEVFGRDQNFDAQSNSIVRVQAARLRQLLEAYYGGAGAADPLRIDMPVGAYRIVVSRRAAEAGPESAPAHAPAASVAAVPARASGARPRLTAALVVLGLVLVAVATAWTLGRRQESAQMDWTRGRPTLTIKIAPDAGAEAALPRLSEGLARALGAFDSMIVTRPAPENRPDTPRAYFLVLNAAPSLHPARLSIELLHARSGALVWTAEFAAPADAEAENAIIATTARAVGDIQGALNMDMMTRVRPWPTRPTGYLCILASLDAIQQRAPESLRRAFDCLEADVAADPDNAYAHGLLAVMLVRRYLDAAPGNQGPADLWRATRLARQAYDRDPQRARSAYILFLVRFYDKRFDEAFVAARRALELNPYVTLYAAQIGASHISRGDYAQGEALLAPVARLDRSSPSFLNAFLALAAFMRADESRFQTLARAASMENGSVGLILRAIAAHRAGDREGVRLAAQMLREKFPGVAADVPATLERYALAPDIVTKLLAQWRALQPDVAGR